MPFPNKPARNLVAHEGPIHVCKYNSLGQYCLSGGQDRKIFLWNPNTGTKIKSYEAHGWEVLDIAVFEDNSKFVSCGGDKTVFLWDVSTGQTIRRFMGHFSRVNTVDFNFDGSVIASGSYDSSIRLWDCKSQSRLPIQVLEDAKDSISSLHVKNHEIIAGSVDGRVRTYDLRMGCLSVDVFGHAVTAIRQSSDDNCILASTLESKIRLLDKSNGQLLQTFSGHVNREYRVRSIFGRADEYVASGSEDGKICIWELVGGKIAYNFEAHPGKVVTCVAIHPRGTQMLSCGTDGQLKVWEQ